MASRLAQLGTHSALHRSARLVRPSFVPISVHARSVASRVSGQPASSNFSETKENAKQETKAALGSIASAISGANTTSSQATGGSDLTIENAGRDLQGTKSLLGAVPREAWLLGGSGYVPYLGASLSTIYLARQAWQAQSASATSSIDFETANALLHHVASLQVTYGAVLLSFLGAIHWGFEFSKFGGEKGYRRYVAGLAPVVLAWPTLMVPHMDLALASQWAIFTLAWYIDLRATNAGWTPKWYSTYRFSLTAIVGSSILVTLFAMNYYSSSGVSNIKELDHKAEKARKRKELDQKDPNASVPKEGKIDGPIETEEGDDSYVTFTNVQKKAEEEKKQKEEEEKQKKEAEKRDKDDSSSSKSSKENQSGDKSKDQKKSTTEDQPKQENSRDKAEKRDDSKVPSKKDESKPKDTSSPKSSDDKSSGDNSKQDANKSVEKGDKAEKKGDNSGQKGDKPAKQQKPAESKSSSQSDKKDPESDKKSSGGKDKRQDE